MKVKDIFGEEVEVVNFHSDNIPLLDYSFYPKLIPSSIRMKLLKDSQKENKSELQMILKIIFDYYNSKQKTFERINLLESRLKEIKKSTAGKIILSEILRLEK